MDFNFDKFLSEADEYLVEGDEGQASNKLYKCAEEAIKFMAEKLGLEEYQEAQTNGRWDTRLLFNSAIKLSHQICKEIREYWAAAWCLHVEGFHERKLGIEVVKDMPQDVKELVKITKRYR